MTIQIFQSNQSLNKAAFAELPSSELAQQPTKKSQAVKDMIKANRLNAIALENKKLGQLLPDSSAVLDDTFSPKFTKRAQKLDSMENLSLLCELPYSSEPTKAKKQAPKTLLQKFVASIVSGAGALKSGIVSLSSAIGSILGATWNAIKGGFKFVTGQKTTVSVNSNGTKVVSDDAGAEKMGFKEAIGQKPTLTPAAAQIQISEKASKQAVDEQNEQMLMNEFHQS